jgi:thiamine pyrophosphokinase
MKVVVFANGAVSADTPTRRHLRDAALVIAVDGGARHCRALGVVPGILVGDMDSADPQDLKRFAEKGTRLIRHPRRKDKTDLALALELALARQAGEIIVFGALGHRWDMSLANLMLLTDPAFTDIRLALIDGGTRVSLLRGSAGLTVIGRPGDTVSLIPVGGPARGVTLEGFDYPLDRQTIGEASTLGISNTLVRERGVVRLERGLLFCVVLERPAVA